MFVYIYNRSIYNVNMQRIDADIKWKEYYNNIQFIWGDWSKKWPRPKVTFPTIDPYYVPLGLLKKEYKALLKEVQKEIDIRQEQMRVHGLNSPTGMFIDIYKGEYVEMKKKINYIIELKENEGTMELEKAKQYPIENIIEIGRGDFALCPFHQEKTPSAKYYREENRLHCFGSCSKGFDSVDIYMQQNNVDFLTAIKALS